MRLQTVVEAPTHLTNPVPAVLTWQQALLAVIYPFGQEALASIRGANPKVAGSYSLQAIEEGHAVGWGIGSTWPKWWTLEYTMPAHTITPKNALYLVFEGRDGHLVRTTSVQHPGHRGNNAIHDAVDTAEMQIRAAIPNAVRVIWTGEGG